MDKTNMKDDELLSAYIDGELVADEVAVVVERLANEHALVRRLEAMRSSDDAVRAVYEQLDEKPLPDGVNQLLDLAENKIETSKVVSFPVRGMRRFANMPVALAASVALVAGFLAIRQMQVEPQTNGVEALIAGQLDIGSEVYDLLERGVSGEPGVLGESSEMRIVLSFESEGGDYCRQLFVGATDRSVHGVACRAATGWQLEAVALGAPGTPGGQFQPAAVDTPEAVSEAIDGLIGARDPLNQDEERALISTAWKKLSE